MSQGDPRFNISAEDLADLIKAATEFKMNGSPARSTITKALDRIELLMSMSNPTHQDTVNCLLDVQDILASFQ